MPATFMLRKYLRAQEIAARPENQRRRAIEIEAARLGAADREAKYPEITFENFDEANAYQNVRIAVHKARLFSEGEDQ